MKDKLDKWDYILAVSSGAIAAAFDEVFVGEFSLDNAYKWGNDHIDEVVKRIAKRAGLKGDDDLKKAIRHLEENHRIISDAMTNPFGGGTQHHLRDFTHHPNRMGLFFSFIQEITGYTCGTDQRGNFMKLKNPEWKKPSSFKEALYSSTIRWLFHMISDIDGSSNSPGKGTGLPGPFLSFTKMLSSMPVIKRLAGKDENERYRFSEACNTLFFEKGIDYREELGLAHEASKQLIPVIVSEVVVSSFYSVRQLVKQLQTKEIRSIGDIRKIDISEVLPWKSSKIVHMRMISSATFSTIDVGVAGIHAAMTSAGDKKRFIAEFLKRVNFAGVGRLTLAGINEVGLLSNKTYESFRKVCDTNDGNKFIAATEVVVDHSQEVVGAVSSIAAMGTPFGFVGAAIGVYSEISNSIKEYHIAKEDRIRIEQECEEKIRVINEYRDQIETVVNEYMEDRLEIFDEAFELIDSAVKENDSEKFIAGNVKIQKKLGKDDSFSSQAEFDEIMFSEEDFRL